MFSPAVLFALGVVVAVLYLPRAGGRIRWARSIRKTVPVALFAVAALVEGAPVLLVAALGLSAIGDFALSRPGERAFLAGMVAFAAAHLAFVALMIALGAQLHIGHWPWFFGAVVLAVSTEWWLRPFTGTLKWPVRGYIGIVLALGLTAIGLPDARWVAIVGALLFILSDLILSIEAFILPQGHRARKPLAVIVWVTYIAAQIGLFWGLGAV